MSGEIFEDDKSYEARMGLFLEWFAFDRPLNGSETPLDRLLQNNPDTAANADPSLIEGLKQSRHSLFVLLKSRQDHVVVLDLFEDEAGGAGR